MAYLNPQTGEVLSFADIELKASEMIPPISASQYIDDLDLSFQEEIPQEVKEDFQVDIASPDASVMSNPSASQTSFTESDFSGDPISVESQNKNKRDEAYSGIDLAQSELDKYLEENPGSDQASQPSGSNMRTILENQKYQELDKKVHFKKIY